MSETQILDQVEAALRLVQAAYRAERRDGMPPQELRALAGDVRATLDTLKDDPDTAMLALARIVLTAVRRAALARGGDPEEELVVVARHARHGLPGADRGRAPFDPPPPGEIF